MTAVALPDRVLPWTALVLLTVAIPLQRFAVPVGGAGIALILPLTLTTVAVLAAWDRAYVDPLRLILFGVFVATAAVSAAVNVDDASAQSFALLLATYTPFLFVVPVSREAWLRVLNVFQGIAAVCAVLGLIQFFAQFAISSPFLFTFRDLLPDEVLLQGYNTAIPLSYGASVFKSNGGVLLEPSIFSQYTALALLIEILLFGRPFRLALFAAALPTAYSGTGLLLLAVFLVPVLLHRRSFALAGGLAAGAVAAAALGNLWHLDALISRVGELGSTQTSGFARFLSAFWLLDDFVLGDPLAIAFGRGPGSITAAVSAVSYTAHDPTWGKALFEYGLAGTTALAAFVGVCLFQGSPSRWLSGFLLFGYLFFGGMLLDPRYSALMLILATLPRIDVAEGSNVADSSFHEHRIAAS